MGRARNHTTQVFSAVPAKVDSLPAAGSTVPVEPATGLVERGGFSASVSRMGDQLILVLPGGATSHIEAGLLWRECRSAAGRRRRMLDQPPSPPADLAIVRIAPVGSYGINIAFSDGHDRGIYPWVFLDELARRPSIDDFIISQAHT